MSSEPLANRIDLLVPAAIMGASGSMKLTTRMSADMFEAWGYPRWWAPVTGTLEVTSAVLISRPRSSLLGGTVAGLVLAGAVATHIQHREWGMVAVPAVTGALLLRALWRRRVQAVAPVLESAPMAEGAARTEARQHAQQR